jgi:hypothetical protein
MPRYMLAAAAALTVVSAANAEVIYDSEGFETFGNTTLIGQSNSVQPTLLWSEERDDGAEANVKTNVPVTSGIKAVELISTIEPGTPVSSEDQFVGVPVPNSATPVDLTSPSEPIIVSFSLNVAGSNNNSGIGPVFGVEAFDENGTPNNPVLAGGVTVDATNGNVLVRNATGDYVDTGTDVPLQVYSDFELELDYVALTYEVRINGSTIASNLPFVNNTAAFGSAQAFADDFTDAPLVTFGNTDPGGTQADDPTAPIVSIAYYDDYRIAVPEPASLGLVAAAGLGLIRRRA